MDSHENLILNYWVATTKGLGYIKARKLEENVAPLKELFYDHALIKNSKIRLKEDTKDELIRRADEKMLRSELNALYKNGIRVTSYNDEDYPSLLSEIHDPPLVLYYRGDLKKLSRFRLAVVGTRNPSYSGGENTARLCEELSRSGVSIISGMARGIDSIAAEAALRGGTPTAAVLGSGIDVPYPKSNEKLYREIIKNGVVISEYPPGTPPTPEHFPQRNRIISGMSSAVFITEGKIRSGGAITVRNALEQNRDVYALPGDISNPLSELPNSLIADGAAVVLRSEDSLDGMGLNAAAPVFNENSDIKLDFSEQRLYTLLKQGELSADKLSELSGMDISKTMLTLTMLEIKKAVKRLPGNLFAINRSK